jgi:pSer/pThr/pTyr-binding forkhead associated (FHA) protein
MLKAELRVVGGKHHGKVIPLSIGKFLIGREQDCQLRPNSELVSRHHCAFTIDNYTVRLRDLGSTNGTFVNNERLVGQVQLKTGDRVRIGKLDFSVSVREVAEKADSSAAVTMPPSLGTETAELNSAETSTEFELPAPEQHPASPEDAPTSDTTVMLPLPNQNGYGSYPPAPEGYAQFPAPAYYQPPGAFPPPAYPYQQPMMPYPPMGMYPQPPMHYPMPGPAYQPQHEAVPSAQSSTAGGVSIPPVRLPNPEHTGIQPEPAKPPSPASESQNGGEGKTEAADAKKPSEKAAEIIRQHFTRRPKT